MDSRISSLQKAQRGPQLRLPTALLVLLCQEQRLSPPPCAPRQHLSPELYTKHQLLRQLVLAMDVIAVALLTKQQRSLEASSFGNLTVSKTIVIQICFTLQ